LRFLSKPITLQFLLGRRTVTASISPLVWLLIVIAAGTGYAFASLRLEAQEVEVARLRELNRDLELDLLKKRVELQRVEALAEARSQELWEELEKRRSELAQLWRMLGQASGQLRPTRPPLASRGGIHAKYSQIQLQLSQNRYEMASLRSAALAHRLAQIEEEKNLRLRRTPSGVPCSGEMTSPFGFRHHPIYGCARLHRGCDFTTPEGTKVFATADGSVATSDWLGGYGKVVEIDHGFGLRTLYAHCGDLYVKKGQEVRRGQLIATVGMTGLTSGPHCHYEVHKDGQAIDPSSYLKAAYKSPQKAVRFSRKWFLDFLADCR